MNINIDQSDTFRTENHKAVESEIPPSLETIADNLKAFALLEVNRKYGRGDGSGENPKDYHNLIHTDGVIVAARTIAELAAKAGKIGVSDIVLVEIAAAYHDFEQDLGGGANEAASADAAEEQMRETGIFSEEDISKVRSMMLATTIYFEDGVMKQSATDSYLTKIMADADLFLLGSESKDQASAAIDLMHEIAKTSTPSAEQIDMFYNNQLKLMQNHTYYTSEASSLYPHQSENALRSKDKARLIRANLDNASKTSQT